MFSIIGYLLNNGEFGLKQTKKNKKAPWVPPIFEFPLKFDNFKQIVSRKFSMSKK
jgi:hypothetical protein